ncbi:MAG TPA: hypothetical protein DEP53_15615 [Bacteroidetes bacterium]|nr:MAG: hypothetical protein A2X66_06010 [Ignavibacteria bacterium GWA2_54_16]HCA81158.1 hypothetical protein [Bacteroidota bacterium]
MSIGGPGSKLSIRLSVTRGKNAFLDDHFNDRVNADSTKEAAMPDLTKHEQYALTITSSLIIAYGRELLGEPADAMPAAVKLYFKVADEVRDENDRIHEQMKINARR